MSSTDSDNSAYASAEDESDEEQDKPLSLVEVSNTDENHNKNPSLTLNENSLEIVLKSTKGRPISIIAIVGSPKCGKSIFINFIKRGLESKESGSRSLLGKKTEILTGFRWNTQKSSENTTAIWVWSRAFLIDGDDNDIAVILMDTEGLSDSKASSAILGLSFLSSSILIYTASPEDSSASMFNPLSTYFKYGLCCLEKDEELSEEDPPFQKLIFLFQNWNNPEEYAFGRRGGKSLLEDKLGRLRGRAKVDTREGLNCFQHVASYLFPPSIDGDISTFEGRLCELNEEFDSQLDRFINNLLKEDNLQAKKIFGVQLNSTEFSNFLKQYVNMYNDFGKRNNEDVVDEDLILETTCATFHTNIVNKAVEKYHDIFNKRSKKVEAHNQDDLQSIHETAVRQANLQFKRARKLEGYEKEYEEKLQKELEQILQNKLENTFKSRQDFIDGCFKNAEEKLKTGLSEDSDFDPKKAEELKEMITQEFLENFTSDDEENTLELTSTLETALKDILEPFIEKQSVIDEESAKKDMKNLQKQLIREYRTGMEKMLNENLTYDLPTLQNFHSLNLNKIMETFTEFSHNNPFEKETRTEIENSIQRIYKQTVSNILEIVEEEKNKAEEFITLEINSYSDLILQYDSSLDLLAIHQNNKQYIMEKFEQHCKFPVGSTEREVFKTKLENALEEVYNQNKILNENSSSAEKPQMKAEKGNVKKVKNIVEECLQQYESDMVTLRHGADFLEQIKLTKHHQNTQKKALSTFEKLANGTNDGALEILKTRLNTEFNRIIIENERLIELAQANAKNWIHECLKEYQQQMKGSADSCTSPKEFQQAHEKVKKNILVLFGKKWKYNCNKSFRQEHEKNLEIELDATFEEMEDFFKMKINSDVVSAEDLKEDVRKFYHEEMSKNVQPKIHMEPGDLQDLHKRTVKAAISHVKAKTELKKNQKKMLKEWLEGSFHKYKDENDIALNYEDGMEPAIGIDLGTTYCCVAVLVNGKVEIVRNLQGQNTTPSYVRISQQGSEQVVGMVAKDSAHRNAENTIFDAKRMIGRRFEDKKLQNDMNYWPFTVVKGEEGPAIQVFGNQYPPEQIASFLLRQLVTDAEKYLGKTVTKAVITVPAYFTDGQRQATIDAGEMAGLQVLTILNEPTAASIAYKMERFHEDARNVLIFDLGGGTFDVAILKSDAGSIEILAVDGDTHLGGEDFDKAMMQYCATKFQNEHNLDPFKGKDSEQKVERDKAKQRLRRLQTYCEKRKIDLSFARSTTISVDTFQEGTDLEMAISRDTFEDLISPYLSKALEIVGRALETAQLSKAEIEDIVLVGGSTRIPKVQELLSQFFNGKALNHTINPDEAVAYGAAVKAALMNGDSAKKMFNFTTIQDVTPMSLGVEAYVNGVPGHFSAIIPKSSKIPTVILQNYNTLLDNQESVLVKIYQGEAHVAKDNEFLGEFILKGIPPAAAGKELVEVYMDINDMGILHVTAVCKSTKGRETLVVSENKGRLSRGTKEKLLKEAKDTDEAVQRRSYTDFTEPGSEKGREYRKRPKSFLSKFLR